MFFKSTLFNALSLGLVTASVIPEALVKKGIPTKSSPRQTCTNGPSDRGCWDPANGFSIATDAETSWPNTGVVVPYTLTITEGTWAPDGFSREMLLINGAFPGPTITANWGDTLQITVINNMVNNGTSIHWHGISQRDSSMMDGANGVTECPIAGNGGTRVYTFVANEHGTSWYHSHYSAQYGDGVVGKIQINGPATANYDIDLGPLPIQDFYYATMYSVALAAGTTGPPKADNMLINGLNKNVAGTTGSYSVTNLTSGSKHRLRLINTSIDSGIYVSLDSHTFEVIEADFVPIVPYNTTWIFLAIGQRYDVIINANQTPASYWFRVALASGCGSNANSNIRAVFNYDGITYADPTTTAATRPLTACADETNLVPYNAKSVNSSQFDFDTSGAHTIGAPVKNTTTNLFMWSIDGVPIDVDWENPTLSYVEQGITTFPSNLRVYEVPQVNEWVFWVIQNKAGVAHPIHLHGHDFYLLGAASATTFSDSLVSSLNFVNPPRRDVAILQGTGYLVLGFLTDNPGAWLMHCHIAFHVGEGLAVQFLERPDEIAGLMDLSAIQPACDSFDTWYAASPFKKDDSGL